MWFAKFGIESHESVKIWNSYFDVIEIYKFAARKTFPLHTLTSVLVTLLGVAKEIDCS